MLGGKDGGSFFFLILFFFFLFLSVSSLFAPRFFCRCCGARFGVGDQDSTPAGWHSKRREMQGPAMIFSCRFFTWFWVEGSQVSGEGDIGRLRFGGII